MAEKIYIWYAEDDIDDQDIFKECMRRVDPFIQVICFSNGRLLFDFLESLPTDALLPACIILDMNMPFWTGMKTLEALKTNPAYQELPVFIFSTSSAETEKKRAEQMKAEAYLTKPFAQSDLLKICEEFAEYANRTSHFKKNSRMSIM